MGYGDLGCYGQKYISTPRIDSMAREGMKFTQAYAGSPVSAPSRASLMTGQHSGHCEVRGNKEYWGNVPMVKYGVNEDFSVVGQHPYDPDHVILPEIMKDRGYNTGMFGKWAGGYENSVSTPTSVAWMNSTAIYASSRHISITPTSSTATARSLATPGWCVLSWRIISNILCTVRNIVSARSIQPT